MPVFNIAANQIPVEPISNYYKGRALRANIEAQELENEYAPAREDRAERAIEVQGGNLGQRIAEFEHLVGQERAKKSAWDLYAAVSDVNTRFQSGESDEDAALALASEKLIDYADSLPDEAGDQADAIRGAIQDRDGLTIDEWQEIGRRAESTAQYYGLTGGGESQFAKVNPATLAEKFTPDSINRWLGTQNPADLVPRDGGTEGDLRSRKISDVSEMLGGDTETATKIVDGLIEMKQNPATGVIEMTDKVTGKAWEIPLENRDEVVVAPEDGKTLWNLSNFASGPSSAISAAWNVPASWLGLPVAHKVADARQTFRTTNQNFIRALSINPRFPVGEQERIMEEISLVPAILDSPPLMRDRMRAIHRDLTVRMRQAEADGRNRSLPKDVREGQKANANEIKNYLAILGVPGGQEVEVPDFVKGEDRELWGSYTEDERQTLYPEQYE